MASHSSTLAWEIPWMEEPGGLPSMGSLRVGHYWVPSLSLFTFMHWRRKWQPTLVFLPGEFHGQRSLVGYSPRDHKESDTTERLSLLVYPRAVTAWHIWLLFFTVSKKLTESKETLLFFFNGLICLVLLGPCPGLVLDGFMHVTFYLSEDVNFNCCFQVFFYFLPSSSFNLNIFLVCFVIWCFFKFP